jgi:hypothetical protein
MLQEKELDTFHLERSNHLAELHGQLEGYAASRNKGSLSERDIATMAQTLLQLHKAVLDLCALFEGILDASARNAEVDAEATPGEQDGEEGGSSGEQGEEKEDDDAAAQASAAPTALHKLKGDRTALLSALLLLLPPPIGS